MRIGKEALSGDADWHSWCRKDTRATSYTKRDTPIHRKWHRHAHGSSFGSTLQWHWCRVRPCYRTVGALGFPWSTQRSHGVRPRAPLSVNPCPSLSVFEWRYGTKEASTSDISLVERSAPHLTPSLRVEGWRTPSRTEPWRRTRRCTRSRRNRTRWPHVRSHRSSWGPSSRTNLRDLDTDRFPKSRVCVNNKEALVFVNSHSGKSCMVVIYGGRWMECGASIIHVSVCLF